MRERGDLDENWRSQRTDDVRFDCRWQDLIWILIVAERQVIFLTEIIRPLIVADTRHRIVNGGEKSSELPGRNSPVISFSLGRIRVAARC